MGGFIVGSAVGAIGMNSYINYKAYYGDIAWMKRGHWGPHCNGFWSVDDTVQRVRDAMKENGVPTQEFDRGQLEPK